MEEKKELQDKLRMLESEKVGWKDERQTLLDQSQNVLQHQSKEKDDAIEQATSLQEEYKARLEREKVTTAAFANQKEALEKKITGLRTQLETSEQGKTAVDLKAGELQQQLETLTRVQKAMLNVFSSLRNAHHSTAAPPDNENLDPNVASMFRNPMKRCNECDLIFKSQFDLLLHLGGKTHATRWFVYFI